MPKLKGSEKRKFFKRNEKIVNRVVRGYLAKKKVGIVHGTRATNNQLPRFLKRETLDWDVFVKKPKVRARELEKALDKKYGGDYFYVARGKGSPGVKVYKIKGTTNDEGYVDFATPNKQVPSVPIRGVQFASLKDQKGRAVVNVKNPELKYRRAKDRNLLNRIKVYEKLRGKKI